MTDPALRATLAQTKVSRSPTRRSAFAVLVVVVGITVVAALVANAMMKLPQSDQAIQRYHAGLQARALAKSAWRAARSRAATGAQPSVTSWAIQPGELPNESWSATVRVALQGDSQHPQWAIDVVLRQKDQTVYRFQTIFPDASGARGTPATSRQEPPPASH